MSHDSPQWIPPDTAGVTSLEKGKKEYAVSIGQSFPLFPQGFTQRLRWEDKPFPQYVSKKALIFPTGNRLELTTTAYDPYSSTSSKPIVAPFHPEIGYRINQDDFDATKGEEKYNQWMRNFVSEQLKATDPLYLLTSIDGLNDEEQRMIDRLHLQVSANGLNCRADKFFIDPVNKSEATFGTFYPLDTGPLPYLPEGGFYIYFPDDVETLRKLQGRFVLTE